MGDLGAVTATLATRCRSRARSRKHASAPRRFCTRPNRPSSTPFPARTLGEHASGAVGRGGRSIFLTVDPLVAAHQAYAYGNDNPVNETDPLGLCSGWLGCITHYVGEGAEYAAVGATTVAIGATVVATDGTDAPLAVEAEGGLLSTLSVTSAEDAATASSVARTASAVSTGFGGLQSVAQCTGIAAHEATAGNCGADIGSTLLGGTGLRIGSAAGLSGPANLLFANSLSLLGDGFSDGPWGYNQVGQSMSRPTPCEQQQTIASLQLLLGGGLP